jgi:large subunit ribosomal protein L30
LDALGLRKMNQVVEHEDNEVIRGMIKRVHHLVTIVE